jgi:NAD(P)-dependent dehydrogenase (short-subunit alcohol dehydrogenase family)
MASLDGHIALVTGGGRGIGRGIALALARHGAAVAVMARSTEEIDRVAEEIRDAGGRGLAVAGDVSKRADIEIGLQRIHDSLGTVDILINNAGIIGPIHALLESEPDRWAHTQEVNLLGAFYCLQAVLPGMLKTGWGRVVNVTSGAAHGSGIRHMSAYSVSKAGLEALTWAAAAELEGSGVCVTAVAPGTVDTAMQDEVRSTPPEEASPATYERFQNYVEQDRLTDPREVGEAFAAIVMSEAHGVRLDVRELPAEIAGLVGGA